MKTENFIKLIRELTGRPFQLGNEFGFPLRENEIEPGKTYRVFRDLDLTGKRVSFQWKAALDEENLLRSFLTAFCRGYREPNPEQFGEMQPGNRWEDWSEAKRESAFFYHRDFMFTKDELMQQIETRFKLPEMRAVFMRHGFYSTCYGVGIYCLFSSASLESAIDEMRGWLTHRGVGFSNEFSKAGWVLRFKLGLSREIHAGLLTEFSNASTI